MKQQVIIFCGPDRCGKTEIANELSKKINVPVFKSKWEHFTMKFEKNENFTNDCDLLEEYSDSKHKKTSNVEMNVKFVDQLRIADPRIADFIVSTKTSVIFDRSWPCEWVYSRLFNRETSVDTIKLLEKMYKSIDAKIVICVRNSYVGISDDIDERITSDKLQQIHDLYLEFSKWTKCKYMLLNVDDENLERETNEVISFLTNT